MEQGELNFKVKIFDEGDDYKSLLPDFSGVGEVIDKQGLEVQVKVLETLNRILSDLQEKSFDGRIDHNFPLFIDKRIYENPCELLAEIALLSENIKEISDLGMTQVGVAANRVLEELVATMKKNGNWTKGHEKIWQTHTQNPHEIRLN